MTHQLCIADHRDNPPTALGGLKLCGGHHAALTEALTGPSAAEDPTMDVAWGVRENNVTIYRMASRAHAAEYARRAVLPPPNARRTWCSLVFSAEVVCGDGITWQAPRDYRPGGLVRDYTALTLRMTGLSTGERASYVVHSAEVSLPVPDGIANLRSQMRHDLAWWVAKHVEDGGTRAPARDAEPAVLAAWLAIHRDWAAAQDWAGDYVAVLGELRARARRLIDLPRAPREQVAPCPEPGCGGMLWSSIRDAPRLSAVTCDTCGNEWDSTRWMALMLRLRRAG